MKNAADGYSNGGATPYGYQRVPAKDNPKRRSLVPEPSEAWQVQQIFRYREQGLGMRLIVTRLADAGHLHRGKPWTVATVQAVLRSEAVIGRIVFNKRDRRGSNTNRPESEWSRVMAHEAIIEIEAWQRVQHSMDALKNDNRGSPLSGHLFTGLLKCGHCGSAMQIETAKGRNHRYSYYNCSGWQKKRTCRPQRRNTEEVDAWLMDSIRDKVFTVTALREVAGQLNVEHGRAAQDRRAQIKALQKESEDAVRRKRSLMEILELHGREAPNLGDIGDRLKELNAGIKSRAEKIKLIEEEPDQQFEVSEALVAQLRQTLLDIVGDPTKAKAVRTLLCRFIENVVLDSDTAEVHYRAEFMADMKRQGLAVHTSHKWLRDQDSNLGLELELD